MAEPLTRLLLNKAEESRRIKIRIIEGLADAGLTVSARTAVENVIDELSLDVKVDGQGRLKRRS